MKRQDSSSSLLSPCSSSRRQRSPEKLHSTTIGCMSGLFRLLSKYQNRRKFLTFGKKPDQKSQSASSKAAKSAGASPIRDDDKIRDACDRRLSCDVPRSPTLPAEIRRSNSVNSPENYRTPPALVARLMGLNSESCGDGATESAAEKRQKLLGALERCDRDLKALKRIIEAVQSQPPRVEDCAGKLAAETKRCSSTPELVSGEQPSPVSVLDELTRSPLCSYTRRSHATATAATGRGIAQQHKKRGGGEEDAIKLSLLDRIMTEYFQTRSSVKVASSTSPTLSMVESVNEACRDVAWGEKREVGRIGVALQDLICRDLIEEFVKDITCPRYTCVYSKSLPFEACKRKLRF